MNSTVLVTGARGFIGSRLSEILSKREYNVRISTRKALKNDQAPNVFEVKDLGLNANWTEALKDVDVVVHLAGRAHILNETMDDPLREFMYINTQGTMHLAREAIKAGVRRFIYVSSIGVNGRCTHGKPFDGQPGVCPTRPFT